MVAVAAVADGEAARDFLEVVALDLLGVAASFSSCCWRCCGCFFALSSSTLLVLAAGAFAAAMSSCVFLDARLSASVDLEPAAPDDTAAAPEPAADLDLPREDEAADEVCELGERWLEGGAGAAASAEEAAGATMAPEEEEVEAAPPLNESSPLASWGTSSVVVVVVVAATASPSCCCCC